MDEKNKNTLVMTNEQMVEFCQRIRNNLQKKAISMKKAFEKNSNDDSAKKLVSAAEDLCAFDKLVELCAALGKRVIELDDMKRSRTNCQMKKEDLN
jgi:hypothetical protein